MSHIQFGVPNHDYYDLGDLAGDQDPEAFPLPFNVCPPGQHFNVSTLRCESDEGIDPDVAMCPPGTTGTPPMCIPGQLPLPIPPGIPPQQIPPGLPVVTEEQCKARELAAYNEGKSETLKAAIIGGVVSAVAGAVAGYALSRVLK